MSCAYISIRINMFFFFKNVTWWNLKKWYKSTYLQNGNRVTDVESRLTVAKEESGGEG